MARKLVVGVNFLFIVVKKVHFDFLISKANISPL